MEYPQLTSGHKLNFDILIVIMLFKLSNINPHWEFVVVQYIDQQTHSVNYIKI
jgi:hypothetical protein